MKQPDTLFRKEVIWCRNGDRSIYGVAFLPLVEGKHPLVLFSHELGNNHRSGIPYAKRLAAMGYAVYTYDFCGGSVAGNRSDGKTTEMTVSTEVSDLETVLTVARTWELVDTERIILMGASQGGVVSTLAALEHSGEVRGLVLLYPAFSAVKHVRSMFPSLDAVPAEFDMFGGYIHLGRAYAADLWDRDFYRLLPNYQKRVLLLHGDSDGTVPLSFSERTAAALPDCAFYIIPGGEHGFAGTQLEEAMGYIAGYLANI